MYDTEDLSDCRMVITCGGGKGGAPRIKGRGRTIASRKRRLKAAKRKRGGKRAARTRSQPGKTRKGRQKQARSVGGARGRRRRRR